MKIADIQISNEFPAEIRKASTLATALFDKSIVSFFTMDLKRRTRISNRLKI